MTLPLCGKTKWTILLWSFSDAETGLQQHLCQWGWSLHCQYLLLGGAPVTHLSIHYGHITCAVLKIKSAQRRQKAFGTCGSHLMVVIIFFETLISMYLQPPSTYAQDVNKSIAHSSMLLVTPCLIPDSCFEKQRSQRSTKETNEENLDLRQD